MTGNTLRIERDEGNDGTVEGVSKLTVGADGLIESFNREASSDGVSAESTTYSAEGGRVVRVEVDAGADGTIDQTERLLYDAAGRIASIGFDFDGDDVANDVLDIVRVGNGLVVRLEEDYGNDGGIDVVRTLTYEEGPCDANDIANAAHPVIDICL